MIRKIKFLLNIVLYITLITGMQYSYSQQRQTGTITGEVQDARSGTSLPNANIVLLNTRIGTATDRNGNFTLDRVPVGTYTLRVSYIGYEQYETEIEIDAGETISLRIELRDQYVETEEVVVQGVLEGQARSFMEQRTSSSQRNIVSSEQMDRFGDYNLTAALARIPGMSIRYSAGEPESFRFRGMEQGRVQVSVDGEPMPSNSFTGRGTSISGLTADMISSLEVIKALTPDMDAQTIAGTVNLRTSSPTSETPSILVRSGAEYTDYTRSTDPRVSVRYSQRVSRKFGLTLQADFRRTNRLQEQFNHNWTVQRLNDEIGTEWMPLLGRFQPSFDTRQRDNIGMSGQLNYIISNRAHYYLRGLFNQQDDITERTSLQIRLDRGTHILPDSVVNARIFRQPYYREDFSKTMTVTLGGENTLPVIKLDYNITFSEANRERPFGMGFEWRNMFRNQFSYDLADPYHPRIRSSADAEEMLYNEDLYMFYTMDIDSIEAQDFRYRGTFNATVPIRLLGYPVEIKFGGRADLQDRYYDNRQARELHRGVLWMTDYAKFVDRTMIGSDNFQYGPEVDFEKFKEYYIDNRENFHIDLDWTDQRRINSFDSREGVYAAYVMQTWKIGDLTLLGGLRAEYTDAEYEGYISRWDARGRWIGRDTLTVGRDYINYFPGFHIRYDIDLSTVVRFAWTNSIQRPNFDDLSPMRRIRQQQMEIRSGNPNLNPERSMKFDISIERYFGRVGMFSAALFYMNTDDFIYTATTSVVGDEFPEAEEYLGWEIRRPVNGEGALLYGVELAWQQQLSFLPGYLSGLGVYANYTYTHSETRVISQVADEPRDVTYPGTMPHVANFALSYSEGGFTGQVSLHYISGFLNRFEGTSIGGSSNEYGHETRSSLYFDEYEVGSFSWDVTVSQRILEFLRLTLELKNIVNTPRDKRYLESAVGSIEDIPRLGNFTMADGIKYTGWSGFIGLRVDF